jgi:hypothetical protein
MNYPAAFYPSDPKDPRATGGFAVVASGKFDANTEVDTVVRPIPSGEEFVVREVEGFRQALTHAEGASVWQQDFVSSSDEWDTWFHLNAHNARRMTLSFEKVIAIIGTLDKHDLHSTKSNWDSELVREPIHEPEVGKSEPQASLPLQGGFTPSGELVVLWTECLRDLAAAGGRKNIDMALASASAGERAHQFATMFRSAIGSYAQYLRYEGAEDTRLFANGRVSPAFQIALAQQFYIVPDKGARFLELLGANFVSALDSGWKVEADWGYLRLTEDRSVELLLKPVEYLDDPDFIESEDVE